MLSPIELKREAQIVARRLHKQKAWLENRAGSAMQNDCWIVVSARTTNKTRMTPLNIDLVSRMQTSGWLQPDPSGALRLSPAGMKNLLSLDVSGRLQASHQLRAEKTISDAENRTVYVSTNQTESPLGWMRARKDKSGKPLISDEQFEAGEKIRRDFTLAQMSPRVTSSWEFTSTVSQKSSFQGDGAIELTHKIMAARDRLFAALQMLGPEMSSIIMEVCCMSAGLESAERKLGWPRRSGKLVLQIALDKLALHYGIVLPEKAAPPVANVKSWGVDGFRPDIAPGD